MRHDNRRREAAGRISPPLWVWLGLAVSASLPALCMPCNLCMHMPCPTTTWTGSGHGHSGQTCLSISTLHLPCHLPPTFALACWNLLLQSNLPACPPFPLLLLSPSTVYVSVPVAKAGRLKNRKNRQGQALLAARLPHSIKPVCHAMSSSCVY